MNDKTEMVPLVEVVKRERAAFFAGYLTYCDGTKRTDEQSILNATRWAAVAHPLPVVMRPRVVTDNTLVSWRVVGGAIQWKSGTDWNRLSSVTGERIFLTEERVCLLTDLIAAPTETVPLEG